MRLVQRCVRSLRGGTLLPRETVVVVDSNPAVEAALRDELGDQAVVVANRGFGISDARNTGLALVTGDIVAYLDDDADPEAGWLEAIVAMFERRPATVGVGGCVVPEYEPGSPQLPPEVLWIVGCIYRGHRSDEGPITRPIGANMAFRADAVASVGGFSSAFGPAGRSRAGWRRILPGKKTGSNEELALAVTLRRQFGRDCLWYCPAAGVRHFVPRARLSARYVVSRCWVEGTTKADVTALHGRAAMSEDQRYLLHVLLPAIARRFWTAARRLEPSALREAVLLSVAAIVTAAGYATRAVLSAFSSRE
jgi:glucosyl-dolichyl phosphate glucuronosyltransferase